MPTIEVDLNDLQKLLGVELPEETEKLDDILAYVKGEVKARLGSEIHIEIKDSNRPDIWSVEGLARALKGYLGIERGPKRYRVAGESGVKIRVDPRLKEIRPYIACAVIKGLELDDITIRSFIHLQDKLDLTYGRRRGRTSIGLYDFGLIKPPLEYTVSKPREISFVPLGFEEELTLEEILEKHPKGIEYGHIVKRFSIWPILYDSRKKVLSFPPIINSNDLGRITEETEEVLIEVTGTRLDVVLNTLNMVAIAMCDRGGEVYSAEVHYAYGGKEVVTTPQFYTEKMSLELRYLENVLGLKMKPKDVKDLLLKARFGVTSINEKEVVVEVPFYRIDVMHPVDLVEDIAIAYGYDRIQPRWSPPATIGGLTPEREFCDLVRELMVGLGYQEVLTFTLTNPENLFDKMNVKRGKAIEVANPKIRNFTHLRTWILPSLMEFLSHNTHVDYPQKIFEVGIAVVPTQQAENKCIDVNKLACVTAHVDADFTEVKSTLNALLLNLGLEPRYEDVRHGSFIEGRAAEVYVQGKSIGILGEINPVVLENWGLEVPASAFELNLDSIFRLKGEEQEKE
ncbi:phenylalanine--tRNA ligase subunit beta [Candidatus Bathyarchaeota archaeon]|nr:phenylalanine--tRNA ligase subunit beta [Candidatus Bathyarchaeota archaeon]